MLYPSNPLTRKLLAFVPLTVEEQTGLAGAQSAPVTVQRGKEVFREGQNGHSVFIVQAGWTSSYKDLADGGRQIINFAIPGDCVGFRGVLLHASDHAFSALTDATLTTIDAISLNQLFDDFPGIRAAFLSSAARDEAMAVEHLVGVGRRSAIERTAHFFLELTERLMLVGLASETRFKCPLNQYVLADALGPSAIHVNRVLRDLRELKLMSLRSGTLLILDLPGLIKLGHYRSVNNWLRDGGD